MKNVLLLIALLVLLIFLGLLIYQEKSSFKETYIVFYGDITKENVDYISSFDIAVIEPKATNSDINDIIRENNTKVFAYMSTLEIENYDLYKLNRMQSEYYLIIDGKRVYFEKYENYIGDIRVAEFREILLDTIEYRIVSKGYEGVFLDTVDFTEYFDDEINESLQEGYIQFISEINERFPDLLIFQNRGFKAYKSSSGKYIDYLLYEDFSYSKVEEAEYYQNLLSTLINIASDQEASICLLSRDYNDENKAYAKENGLSYYYSSYAEDYVIVNQEELNKVVKQNYDHISFDLEVENVKLLEVEKISNDINDLDEAIELNLFLLKPETVNELNLNDSIVFFNNKAVLVYDQYLMDLGQTDYQSYLVDLVKDHYDKGESLFLLKYLTSINNLPEESVERQILYQAYLDFLDMLKSHMDDIVLIQERGIEFIDFSLIDRLDGVYWNNFDFLAYQSDNWYQNKIQQLHDYQLNYGWRFYID